MTDADIIKTINNGNKKMLSFKKKLKEEQILAVEKYIRSLQAAEAAKK
jgi:mono/diheme cytochrome c family protein